MVKPNIHWIKKILQVSNPKEQHTGSINSTTKSTQLSSPFKMRERRESPISSYSYIKWGLKMGCVGISDHSKRQNCSLAQREGKDVLAQGFCFRVWFRWRVLQHGLRKGWEDLDFSQSACPPPRIWKSDTQCSQPSVAKSAICVRP
jgi:hypothetical protein